MPTRKVLRFACALAGLAVFGAAQAATYTCIDAQGRTTIQQTPCPDPRPPAPPPPPRPKPPCELTAEQLRRAIRMENQFLSRYADEAAHRRAEETDSKPAAERIRDAKARIQALAEQRKPLDKERAFYPKGNLPSALKSKIDANDAQSAAMADILREREQVLAAIQARFRCERDTYGKLWKNAAPGSSACDRPACMPP